MCVSVYTFGQSEEDHKYVIGSSTNVEFVKGVHMNKIYCDICKEEIKPEDTHYVARVARNKRWNDKSRTIDICLRCNNVLNDSERAMEEVTDCIWTKPLESEDSNGLGE